MLVGWNIKLFKQNETLQLVDVYKVNINSSKKVLATRKSQYISETTQYSASFIIFAGATTFLTYFDTKCVKVG